MKLVHGLNHGDGVVMVLDDAAKWGPVCADDWDDMNAEVVCRQMGFYDGGTAQGTLVTQNDESNKLCLDF